MTQPSPAIGCSTCLVLFWDTNLVSTIVYVVTMSCGTPLVYYLGIEENRQTAQEYFRSNMRIFRKSRQPTAEVEMSPSSNEGSRDNQSQLNHHEE